MPARKREPRNATQKLVADHLVSGTIDPGEAIALRIDQTLTQDATGTLVMLELEAMGLDRVATEVSVQYVDHNLVQADHRNADDHLFLESAARRWGLWYSPPGNGVSHPLHMKYFGRPGKTLLGADSHTCAAGALGMLAIGAGGIDVALAMAGEPYTLAMPEVWGVRLVGALPDWVSAKDVVLEMLRRHGVDGGIGRVIEYHGPGLAGLCAMDRHVIANMGAELGATTTVFPADEAVRDFLERHGRHEDHREVTADPGARYDVTDEIDLSRLEPLVACPTSPGNVVPVREVAGRPIYQAYVGSSANPGYRDFAVAAMMVEGRHVAPGVSFDVNPTSRQLVLDLVREGLLGRLLHAGARLHQAGCNGCIGMGQAPATGRNSLRTTPRNFPGRSGTREDSVYLCSPETATASALTGVVTDPRDLRMPYPRIERLDDPAFDWAAFTAPLPPEEARRVELVKGPNVVSLPDFAPLPDALEVPVVLVVGDDVSTDEILPAGAEVLPYRSNLPKIAEYAFRDVDDGYVARAKEAGDHAIVGGVNYGQGSSREHAAAAPRHLGLRLVVARGFARIHRQNLINFGVLPATVADGDDGDDVLARLEPGDVLRVAALRRRLEAGQPLTVEVAGKDLSFTVEARLSTREREVLLAGGVARWSAERRQPAAAEPLHV